MTTVDRHRDLDRRAAAAMGEAPGNALLPSRHRGRDSRTLTRAPRVLLLEVEIRTSERTGRSWYSAWLGRARLIGFGHRVIKFYAETPTPRPDKET